MPETSTAPSPTRLGFGRVTGEVARIYRARWRQLLIAGLFVFAPLGLVELIDDWAQHPLLEAELDEVDFGTVAVAALAAAAHAFLALGGEVFYTGVVAAVVIGLRSGERHGLRHLVRTLPWWRLIAIDLLLALIVSLGLLLFVVPGVVLFGWLALVAPVAKIERRGVTASFRRSRELVRGHLLSVLVILLPILIVEDVLATAIQAGVVFELGESALSDWTISVLSNLIAAPLLALAVVVIYFELAGRESSAAQTASR